MKAIFILLSVLAAIFFASAAQVTQVGNSLLISNLKGKAGQTAKLTFKDAASAARNIGAIGTALTKKGL